MNQFLSLLFLQLKDKIDLSWLKDKKAAGRRILLSVVKFIIITGVFFGFLFLTNTLGIFNIVELPKVMNLLLTIVLVLVTISATVQLMKSLYFADDNRVLITLPVKANEIFISKIIVYFIYEVKRSFSLLIPIILSSVILLIFKGNAPVLLALWMWIPTLFIIAFPVLVGTLLSIPAMYITRFFKRVPIVGVVLALGLVGSLITFVIYLIKLIPTNISLVESWQIYGAYVKEFLVKFESKVTPIKYLVKSIIGEKPVSSIKFSLTGLSFLVLLILVIIDVVLFLISFFVSRPLFFTMMAKNFESEKKLDIDKPNRVFGKYITFVNKELLINFRTISISLNYIIVYIIVPISVLLFNQILKSMETSSTGDIYKYVFNILIIVLPLLASNALVATYYSKEGRAAYIKKTKPVQILPVLLSKLVLNVVLSIPTIIITVSIFSNAMGISLVNNIFLIIAVLFLHFGHMITSAKIDIRNPQNEEYATSGDEIDNPNENKSTILAFAISFIYAIVSFKLISEGLYASSLITSTIKLAIISIVFFGCSCLLFYKNIKAYYYD